MSPFAFLTLVNDRRQFDACQASLSGVAPALPQWLMVEPNRHGWNAAQGLNHGIDSLDAEWVVCVHQDVLFPAGFWGRLTGALAELPAGVALAGIAGCERSGRFRGHIVDPNGHCYWPTLPHEVLTLDEVLIAVRKPSGLRFCAEVPGFHCYGADLCFEADLRGWKTVVIDAPLVHLSTGKLDSSYERASQWLMAKWGKRHGHILPMPALLLQDEQEAAWPRRFLQRWRRRRDRLLRNKHRCTDTNCAARLLGASLQVPEQR